MSSECYDPVMNLSLISETHNYWQDWKKKVQKLKYQPLSGSTALLLNLTVVSVSGERKLRALVDTGSAMPLVVKKGIFPASDIQKAVWPVQFVTTSGDAMILGSTCLKLEISFSVAVPETDSVNIVLCERLLAYEANLCSTEVIF